MATGKSERFLFKLTVHVDYTLINIIPVVYY